MLFLTSVFDFAILVPEQSEMGISTLLSSKQFRQEGVLTPSGQS
jgi:hypothetical protein